LIIFSIFLIFIYKIKITERKYEK
jgi:hypothetical protein